MNKDEFVEVAVIGKSIGLKGYLKLYNKSDFYRQFKKGAEFFNSKGEVFVIKDFNKTNDTVLFLNYEDVDLSKKLINTVLYTTKEITRNQFKLKKDEYFYFDIIGLEIYEDSERLGFVSDIEDSLKDYLLEIKTDEELIKAGLTKSFFIPYLDNFIVNIDLKEKKIFVRNSKAILENS